MKTNYKNVFFSENKFNKGTDAHYAVYRAEADCFLRYFLFLRFCSLVYSYHLKSVSAAPHLGKS